MQQLREPEEQQSANLKSIVDRISPAVSVVLQNEAGRDNASLERLAIRENVRASVTALQHGSTILEKLVTDGKLLIVGAEYSLDTGVVEFFQGTA